MATCGIIAYLNANSGAIQAVATVALVGITVWYAWQTQQLVRMQEAGRRERATELRNVVLTIRRGLIELPLNKATAASKMRAATLWDDGDLPALRSLASWFSSDAGDHAARALSSLRWLAEQARRTREPNFNWERFPWDDWYREHAIAQEHVTEIWRAVTGAPLPVPPEPPPDGGPEGSS
jgi:hypothetical protein